MYTAKNDINHMSASIAELTAILEADATKVNFIIIIISLRTFFHSVL